jgi:hypothetical protein|tara:strand:+ start:52 stop:456 length:405 start_codon:yes stop_codon:yes gene_type:complete
MANVIGQGKYTALIDEGGDPVTVTDGRLDVNTTIGVGNSIFTTYLQDTATTSAQTITTLIGAISAITDCKEIIIQADFDNASFFMVGDGDVSSNDTEGIRLQAGDILTLSVSSTDNVSVRAPDSNQKLNISIIR